MGNEPVLTEIIGKQGFVRYDSRIEAVVALHYRIPASGEHISPFQQTLGFAVEVKDLPSEALLYLDYSEVEQLKLKLGCNRLVDMVDKDVRVYYLNSEIIGIEPLKQANPTKP